MSNQETKEKTGIDSDAAEALLEAAQNEYNNEHARIATFDTKMGIMLPVAMAYFLALLPMADFGRIFNIQVTSMWNALIPLSLFTTYSGSLILVIVAICMLVVAALPKKYIAIETRDLYDPVHLRSKVLMQLHLYDKYTDATAKNRDQTNRRMRIYRNACVLIAISIILLAVYNVIRIVIFNGE